MTGQERPARGFKRKTIERTIRNKMRAWINTLPRELQAEVTGGYIVTGGAIASMLQGYLPNDYDVYFQSMETARRVVEHYLKTLKTTSKVSDIGCEARDDRLFIKIKSAGIAEGDDDFDGYEYFETLPPDAAGEYLEMDAFKNVKKKYAVAMISSNAVTLTGDVQIVTRFVGDPEEIHKNYDFVHCTNWFTDRAGLNLRAEAMESILAKELRYVGSRFPICSLFRINKFIKRDWTITAGECLKIAWDINELNLKDIYVLQEQLIGVDAAYWHQVLSILTKDGTDNARLDRTYLFEAISRVFDDAEFVHDDDAEDEGAETEE